MSPGAGAASADPGAGARAGSPVAAWQRSRAVPAPALGALVATAALLALLAARRQDPWLALLAGAVAGPVLVSLLARPELRVAVRVHAPLRAVVDEPSRHRITVQNRGRRSSPPLQLTQRVRGFEDVALAVPALAPGELTELALDRRVLARGVSVTGVHTVRTGAPFGLLRRELTQHGLQRVVVHPRRAEPRDLGALGGDGDLAAGVRARSGHEVHGVREWRRGDDVRHVHWRSTARRGELVVVEPERTTGRRLVLLVACRAGATSPASSTTATVPAPSAHTERLLSITAWSAAAAASTGSVLLSAGPGGPAELESSDPAQVLDWFASLAVTAPLGIDDARAFLARTGDADAVVLAVAADVQAALVEQVRDAAVALGRSVAVFRADPPAGQLP